MPSPRTLFAPLLLLQLLTCSTTLPAQTRPSSPPSSPPCPPCATRGYGAAQDRVIARSLQQYEVLKPLASELKRRGDSLYAANQGLHRVITYQDSARAQGGRQLLIQGRLYQDADNKAQLWRAKARARWWANVGLGALALLLGVIAAH